MKNKILVIEDDRAISELLCMNLEAAGYETVAAYDGEEAQRLPGDFLTALSILIPQIENAVRYLAVECGEPVYNMNEEGIEEIKSMHAVLELEGVKESLDEDLIFALNTIFCSKFGFNMRNNVAHGMLDDQAFQSFKALYIWWFALKFCYLFCGKLQEENRSKINKKLKQLMEKKDNMDEN